MNKWLHKYKLQLQLLACQAGTAYTMDYDLGQSMVFTVFYRRPQLTPVISVSPVN